jgi:hypothetical protein
MTNTNLLQLVNTYRGSDNNTLKNEVFRKITEELKPTINRVAYMIGKKLNAQTMSRTIFPTSPDEAYLEALHILLAFLKYVPSDARNISRLYYLYAQNYISKILKKEYSKYASRCAFTEFSDGLAHDNRQSLLSTESQDTTWQQVYNKMLSRAINEAIAKLPKKEQEISYLMMEGYSLKEIQRKLKVTYFQITQFRNKFKVVLKKIMQEHDVVFS